ncbi:hypothetical protein OHR68_19185 [Spirillospora sp. NBC_00431]
MPCWDGLCRGCCLDISQNGLETRRQKWRQLTLGKPFTFNLKVNWVYLTQPPDHTGHRSHWPTSPTSQRQISPNLLIPGQESLFPAHRDWSTIRALPINELPALTPEAEQLITAFQTFMSEQRWGMGPEKTALRAIRIIAAWLGAQAPIPEDDIRALTANDRRARAKRLIQFLNSRNLLVPAPRQDRDQRKTDALINELPDPLARDLRTWVRVLRGQGRRHHPATSWATICKYLHTFHPVIRAWAPRIVSFREITREDIETALKARKGRGRAGLHVALRSLFRALKQERVIFSDPTKGISVAQPVTIPQPLAKDQLMGAIDRTNGKADKLIVALIALHGLTIADVARLLLADLDLARGRLIVRRATRRHTIYLDELTHTLASNWLRERHRRWPVSANRHLIVTQLTAVDDQHATIHRTTINRLFKKLALNPRQVRIDRIYFEAQQTADPIHLKRLFGISAGTAMKYVQAAHPERTSKLPR